MVKSFTYFHNTKIEFGNGKTKEIMNAIKEIGAKTVLVVTDKQINQIGLVNHIYEILTSNGIAYAIFDDITPNPRTVVVDACGKLCREKHVDAIIAVGGGSVMDVGKGASIIATNDGGIQDYLLLRKDNMKVPTAKPLPVIAVPTTSGTGSEVSECIVITDTDDIKDLMLTTDLLPAYAYIDPELTFKMPPHITANTGLDVLGHAVEAYTSVLDNAVAELMAKEAIRLVFKYLPDAVNKADEKARNHMALASMYAGIAQSKNGCTLPHALSCPLSVLHKVPHGLGVGVSQVAAIEYTKQAIPEKYKEILEFIDPAYADCPEGEAADVLIAKIKQLFVDIKVDPKVDIGSVSETDIIRFSEDAMKEIDIEMSPVGATAADLAKMFKLIIKM